MSGSIRCEKFLKGLGVGYDWFVFGRGRSKYRRVFRSGCRGVWDDFDIRGHVVFCDFNGVFAVHARVDGVGEINGLGLKGQMGKSDRVKGTRSWSCLGGVKIMKKFLLGVLAATASVLGIQSAQAAVPAGLETVFTTAATDFGTITGYGWTLFLAIVGGLILFGLARKVLRRSAGS